MRDIVFGLGQARTDKGQLRLVLIVIRLGVQSDDPVVDNRGERLFRGREGPARRGCLNPGFLGGGQFKGDVHKRKVP